MALPNSEWGAAAGRPRSEARMSLTQIAQPGVEQGAVHPKGNVFAQYEAVQADQSHVLHEPALRGMLSAEGR